MAAPPAGAVTASLHLADNTITFQSPGHEPVAVPLAAINRSKLLQDVVDSSDAEDLVNVPVDWEPLQLWLSHFQDNDSSSNASGSASSAGTAAVPTNNASGAVDDIASISLDSLCALMKVCLQTRDHTQTPGSQAAHSPVFHAPTLAHGYPNASAEMWNRVCDSIDVFLVSQA